MKKFAIALLLALLPLTSAAEYDVADNYRPLRYAGSEGTSGNTVFPVTWPFEDVGDLVVYVSTDAGLSWTLKTLNTHYTTTGKDTDSGTVVFNSGLASGDYVMIFRNDALERQTDFSTLTVTAVNRHMDRQTVQFQQAEELAEKRGIQTTFSNDYDDICGTGVDFDNILPQIGAGSAGRAVVVKPDECGVTLSDGSLDEWACLKCPDGGDDGGTCDGGSNDGLACTSDVDCPGGECDPGVCDGGTNDGESCTLDEDCPGGECDPGTCVGGAAAGDPCEVDSDCPGGYCGAGPDFENCDYISTDNTGTLVCGDGCPSGCGGGGGGCLDCSDIGVCAGGINDGNPCNSSDDCPGGECIPRPPDVCQGGTGDGDPCTDDADCPGGGRCTLNNDVCSDGDFAGETCTTDANCTGTCTGGVCDHDAGACSTNADCGGFCVDPGDRCVGGANDGQVCQDDSQCADGVCLYCRTCFGGGSDGQVCNYDLDCPSGICIECPGAEVCIGGPGDGTACTQDTDCPETNVCDTRDGVGVIGPAGARDNSIARWDGTSGEFLNDSLVTLGDDGYMDSVAGIGFRDRELGANTIKILRPSPQNVTANTNAVIFLPRVGPTVVPGRDADAKQFLVAADHTDLDGAPLTFAELQWKQISYPIHVFQPGASTADQLIARLYFAEDVSCPTTIASSGIVKAGTAFTGAATYTFKKNGASVGTAAFSASDTATITWSSGQTFEPGDYLDIVAPSSPGDGENISFTLPCNRTFN